jgi:hypothetical protein
MLRYARYVLANSVLRAQIKSYARTVLKVDTDRLAGMRSRMVLTCTSIPDRVRGHGRIFQISRVEFEETPVDFRHMLPIIISRGPDFIGVQIMFQFDVPGYNGVYHALELINPELLKMVPRYPFPVISLAYVAFALHRG